MSEQIMPIGELFSQTWSQYKQRALPLIAVMLISSVIIGSLALIMVLCGMFGGAVLTHLMDKMTGLYIIGGLLSLLMLFAFILLIWCQAAMLGIVVDEELGIIEAFLQGWEYLWPLTWVVTILSGILLAGFTFGFFPGFLFLTWFSFSVFILFEEDKRGMESMLMSKEYVRGYGWDTFAKMMVVWFISALIGLVPFVGMILSLLFTPFFMLYLLTMYRDLKSVSGRIDLPSHFSTPWLFWWLVTAVGLIIPIVLLIWMLSFVFTGHQQIIPPAWEGTVGTSL